MQATFPESPLPDELNRLSWSVQCRTTYTQVPERLTLASTQGILPEVNQLRGHTAVSHHQHYQY